MSWQLSCLPNRLKDFTFNLIYNKLAVRNRLSHMVIDNTIDRACTFCTIAKQLPAPEETFTHLFWDCTTARILLNKLITNFIPELTTLGDNELKSFMLTGIAPTRYPTITHATRVTYLYLIWDMHQKNRIWQWETFKINLVFELKKIASASSCQKLGLNTGYHLSAHWDDICKETW